MGQVARRSGLDRPASVLFLNDAVAIAQHPPQPRALRTVLVLCLALVVGALAARAAPDGRQHRVLVLNSESSLVRLVAQINQRANEALKAELGRDTEVFFEWLDANRFPPKDHEQECADFLKKKYAGLGLSGVIAVAEGSLAFAAKYRDEIFRGVPIVHLVVRDTHAAEWNRQPGIYGPLVDFDCVPTLEFALKAHPGTRRIVVINGVSLTDKAWENFIKERAAHFAGRVAFEFWEGLALADILARVAALPGDAVVLTPGLQCDGAGEWMSGAESQEKMAAASARPVYSMIPEFGVEAGTVGGIGPDFGGMGSQAARILAQVLAGRVPAESGAVSPRQAFFHWGQLRRWHIRESTLPPGSVVRHRVPGFFELHWPWVVAGAGVIAVQSGFIAALLVQRRRRLRAERELAHKQQELTHLTRVALLNELTGTLSHEFSQPLATILTSAEAARRHVAGNFHAPELRELLQDIAGAGQRASGLLERLRAMIRRDPPRREPLELNELVRGVLALLRSEFAHRRATVTIALATHPLPIAGDAVPLQQIVLNLLVNACEATAPLPAAERRIEIATHQRDAGTVELRVSNPAGPLAPGDAEQMFAPFFTTKPTGLGLGLAICRQIAADHGGTLTASAGDANRIALVLRLPLSSPVRA